MKLAYETNIHPQADSLLVYNCMYLDSVPVAVGHM